MRHHRRPRRPDRADQKESAQARAARRQTDAGRAGAGAGPVPRAGLAVRPPDHAAPADAPRVGDAAAGRRHRARAAARPRPVLRRHGRSDAQPDRQRRPAGRSAAEFWTGRARLRRVQRRQRAGPARTAPAQPAVAGHRPHRPRYLVAGSALPRKRAAARLRRSARATGAGRTARPSAAAGAAGPAAAMIVGTAGHIDHGKTTLRRALTCVDTDRLKEEKVRGISIELGYAYTALDNGEVPGVIDVPGHEKFIRTMAAGVTGIDFALLVVAADDGIMPQTREHLSILRLLGIRRAAVALTKADRADAGRIAQVERDIQHLLAHTDFAGAPIFRTSATMPGDAG